MKLEILWNQYKHYLELVIGSRTLLDSLATKKDETTTTLSFENAPGGVFENGQIKMATPRLPRTVGERKQEIKSDLSFLEPRLEAIKAEMIKELQRKE